MFPEVAGLAILRSDASQRCCRVLPSLSLSGSSLRPCRRRRGLPDIPEITLGVASQARGRGIGTALMQRLLDTAVADRIAALSLSVEPDNAAMRLYLALGFERVGGSGGSVTLLRTVEPAGNRDA
jgi:GNAT superfamily N-acetyltransferase